MRGCLFSCVFKKCLIFILSENVRNLESEFMKADNHAGLRPFFVREAFLDEFSRTNSRTK